MTADLFSADGGAGGETFEITDEEGPVLAVFGDAAVAAFDQCGIEWYDIHELAEAELFLGECEAEFELGEF